MKINYEISFKLRMGDGQLTTWNNILPDTFVEVVKMDESHGAVKIESGVRHGLVIGLSRKHVSLPEAVACLVD